MRFTVTEDDTAVAMGSGSVSVLATPRLIAWLEAATLEVVETLIDPGMTSVGTQVHIDHLRSTRVGAAVDVSAHLVDRQGRRCVIAVSAVSEEGEPIATGTIARTIVNRAEFESRGV